MAKINITASEFAEKHARRLKAAIPDIQAGIAKVTESPTAKAAAKQEKMQARLNEAIQSGKWAAGLRRVSVEDWKKAITEKGLQRIASGIDGARPKVEAFASQLLAHEANLQNAINSMPDMTLEDSIARAQAWIRGMSKFKRT
jgi:hypothetical protein